MRVDVRVVLDLVAGVSKHFNVVGIAVAPVAGHEESSPGIVFVENIYQLLRVGVFSSHVEGQRDFIIAALHAVYRELTLGCLRANRG